MDHGTARLLRCRPSEERFADDLSDTRGFWTSVYVNSVVLGYNKNI